MKQEQGFSFIELIMVIILLSILAVVAGRILTAGLNSYLTVQNTTDADSQGRIALARMAIDLRNIRSTADITTASANQIVFTDINGNSITYQLSGTTLMRNAQILADGIQTLTFSYFDKNGASTSTTTDIRYITVKLNVQLNNTNFNLITSIYPRNLT